MVVAARPLADVLGRHRPQGPIEAEDASRIRELVERESDPWSRALPLHVTASALIVHPPSRRFLLRWHRRQNAWLQVGGHGDPGETEPLAVALREGHEETGLTDLVPWPAASMVHAVVVPVAALGAEPAHEHADLRFVLATDSPDEARPEKPDAPVRWFSFADAREATTEANVHETLARVERLLAH